MKNRGESEIRAKIFPSLSAFPLQSREQCRMPGIRVAEFSSGMPLTFVSVVGGSEGVLQESERARCTRSMTKSGRCGADADAAADALQESDVVDELGSDAESCSLYSLLLDWLCLCCSFWTKRASRKGRKLERGTGRFPTKTATCKQILSMLYLIYCYCCLSRLSLFSPHTRSTATARAAVKSVFTAAFPCLSSIPCYEGSYCVGRVSVMLFL